MDEKIDRSRRDAVLGGAVLAGTAALLVDGQARAAGASARSWDRSYSGGQLGRTPSAPGEPGRDYVPSVTPGGSTLPWRVVDGAKIYHLVAGEVEHEFAPGLKAKCWGYNGAVHGPTLEAVEGDHVRVYVTNKPPRADDGALARRLLTERHGRRRRPHAASDPAR
jgi:FtsP/CotA-like multicopper oxidase with cupredoxin domain